MTQFGFRASLLSILLIACIACSNGGSDESTATPGSPLAESSTAPASPTATASPTQPAAQLTDLSLVYVDTSKGQGSEIYVARHDGSGAQKVTAVPPGNRPLDARGKNLVFANGSDLLFVDLVTAAVRPLAATSRVGDGRFLDDNTFLFTAAAGCPPGSATSSLVRVDLASLQTRQLASVSSPNLNIAGVDAASQAVALVHRGCDVGVGTIGIYSTSNGGVVQTFEARGCGWVAVSFPARKALVSWLSCTRPPEHATADATLYDFTAGGTQRDVTAPGGGANTQAFLARPGQPEAALGTSMTVGQGPGSVRGGGVWLLNLNTLAFTNLAAADGAEQSAVDWSSDGRYLLVQTVRAMGLCDYSYIDAQTREGRPIAKEVTVCGVNGSVVGWTALR